MSFVLGENGDQLLFQKIQNDNISSMSASVSEPLLAVGTETGIKIFRVIRSQLSLVFIFDEYMILIGQ